MAPEKGLSHNINNHYIKYFLQGEINKFSMLYFNIDI